MYIGTDLIEKNGVYSIMDQIDFTFGIDPLTLPYQTKYGVNYSDCIDNNVLMYTLTNCLDRLESNITLTSLNVNDNLKSIEMELSYNNITLQKEL